MNDILASAPRRAEWPGASAARRKDVRPSRRGLLATWEERLRFRWHLAQMASENPHLIADMGLTLGQVEAETAKPFWRE